MTRKSGQAITEYAVIVAVITIGSIVTVYLLGRLSLGIFANLAVAMKEPHRQTFTPQNSTLGAMDGEAIHRDDLGDFDKGVGITR